VVKGKINLDEIILDYVDKLSNKIKVDKVILFGSRARGEALNDSDVDLVIISDDFKDMDFIRRLEFLSLNWRYPHLAADCLGYTPQEYEELSKRLGIIAEVKQYGKVIYNRLNHHNNQ